MRRGLIRRLERVEARLSASGPCRLLVEIEQSDGTYLPNYSEEDLKRAKQVIRVSFVEPVERDPEED